MGKGKVVSISPPGTPTTWSIVLCTKETSDTLPVVKNSIYTCSPPPAVALHKDFCGGTVAGSCLSFKFIKKADGTIVINPTTVVVTSNC